MDVEHWKRYFPADVVARAELLRKTATLESAGDTLHADVYAHKPGAPVVVFNHGSVGYCRMFAAVACRFHEKGYTFVALDQRGNGYSSGRRGDLTVAQSVQNICDGARWAQRFGGPVFLMGASVGGALTYYAAAAGAPARAIACLNLMDFSAKETARALAKTPQLSFMSAPLGWLSLLLGGMRLPRGMFARVDAVLDPRDANKQEALLKDPVPPSSWSLRFLHSFATQAPAQTFEECRVPVLVMNQGADKMISPQLTRNAYERLGGEKKYLELEGWGHWSFEPGFTNAIVDAAADWFGARATRAL